MTSARSHRRPPAARPAASRLEIGIFIVGLLAAAVSGVVAYRIVGPYGDGPLTFGYYRVRDPETGRSLLVQDVNTEHGIVRRVIDGRRLSQVQLEVGGQDPERVSVHVKGSEITQIDRDRDGDGRVDAWEYYDQHKQLVKVGFSLANDGVLDAWAYRNADGQIEKVEVSTRRNGTIDRWEYYDKGQLARVEQDTTHDGRVDRWMSYQDGILMNTSTVPPSGSR
jgi:hypothetical protein